MGLKRWLNGLSTGQASMKTEVKSSATTYCPDTVACVYKLSASACRSQRQEDAPGLVKQAYTVANRIHYVRKVEDKNQFPRLLSDMDMGSIAHTHLHCHIFNFLIDFSSDLIFPWALVFK